MQEDPEADCYTARVFTSNLILIKKPNGTNMQELSTPAQLLQWTIMPSTIMLQTSRNGNLSTFFLFSRTRAKNETLSCHPSISTLIRGRKKKLNLKLNEEGWGLFQVARLDMKPEKCGRLQMTQKRSKAASFFLGSGSKEEGDSNMTG
jgi:hypothetical protein